MSAIDDNAPPGLQWLRLLAPRPGRIEFTTRLALICALTTLMTAVYQTPEPALTAYVAFFLNRPERTTSLVLSVALTVVVSLLIGLIFLIANAVVDEPLWRVISIGLISFGFLFLASASKLRPVAGTLALIVGYALDILGTVPAGELATRGLLYAWLFVAIPAGISLLVNLLLAPSPRHTAEQALARRLRLAAAALRRPGEQELKRLGQAVYQGTAPVLQLLKLAGAEKTAPAADLAALRHATLSCWALASAIHTAQSTPGEALPESIRSPLAETLEQMAGILQRGGYPVEVSADLPPAPGATPFGTRLQQEIHDALQRFAEAEPAPAVPPRAVPPQEEHGGFFLSDAFTSPAHVQFALKTTAAALFCYVLYNLLDWPGIHTCFLTVYIVAQTTAGESVEKLTLRILGCLAGAAAGIAAIVYLMPGLTSVGGLLFTVFAGAWLAAYVAAGSARISYAGFQIAFAFFLCVIQGAGPAFDMVVVRDRIIGILIGNLVAWFAAVHIWPATVSRRVDMTLMSALKCMAGLPRTPGREERRGLACEAHAALSSTQDDLDIAGYEPPSIRPAGDWLSTRRQAVRECRSLTGLLALGPDPAGTPDPAAELQRLERLVTPPTAQHGVHGHARS